MHRNLIGITCLLLATPAAASTTINGGNIINQTWTQAGSPYLVQGDVIVPAGSTLTIQPGAVVLLASSDAQAAGSDTARVEIIVNGALAASGTAGNPITFQGQSASAGSWYGILVNGTATLAQTKVQHARYAITSNAAGTGLVVSDAQLTSNQSAGLYILAGSPTLTNVYVSSGDTSNTNFGLYVGNAASPTVVSGTFVSNYIGVYQSASSPATVALRYCTFYGNRYGVETVSSSSNVDLKNSIVTNQISYGLYNGGGTVTATYTDLWTNGSGNAGTISGGTGNLATNPLYASPATNLELTSNSPCRFASDGASDLGAHPYVSTPTNGLTGTLWTDTRLTAAGSPYAVTGDLTISANVTLTIDPGVTVNFGSSDLMAAGSDTARVELIALGTLAASGTAGSPIVLTGASKSAGSWYGIELNGTHAATLTRFAESYARYGVTCNGAAPTLHHGTMTSNQSASLYVLAGAPAFDALQLSSGDTSNTNFGLYVGNGATPSLTNSVVNANYIGVYQSASSPATTTLTNVTLYGNRYGVETVSSSSSVVIKNAIVTNQISYGLYNGGGTISVTYSDLWTNGSGNAGTISGGTGNLATNPQYVNAGSGDLHLQATSVCIDAGDPSGAPNHDRDDVVRPVDGDGLNGAQYDLGAYEYAAVTVCGNGIVEAGEACDDGAHNGMYGYCNSACSGPGPRCGDGSLNGSETCDDGNANGTYGHCNATCTAEGAHCGDGTTNGPEACDDGVSNGSYGHCNSICSGPGPHCGDGVKNGAESCDDGTANGTYAHCNAGCTALGPRCGDGVKNGPEACDDGVANGMPGDPCSAMCTAVTGSDGGTTGSDGGTTGSDGGTTGSDGGTTGSDGGTTGGDGSIIGGDDGGGIGGGGGDDAGHGNSVRNSGCGMSGRPIAPDAGPCLLILLPIALFARRRRTA